MRIKKWSFAKIIFVLIFLNLFQFLGYVNPFTRFTAVAITNEETAITYARTMLHAFNIKTENYVFTSAFSWRVMSWHVKVSPTDNMSESKHFFKFRALTGQLIYDNIYIDAVIDDSLITDAENFLSQSLSLFFGLSSEEPAILPVEILDENQYMKTNIR